MDAFRITTEYRRDDVLPNRFAFDQQTTAQTARLAVENPLNRWLQLSGGIDAIFFSDDNASLAAEGTADFTLLKRPGQLLASIGGRYRTTRETSVIGTSDEGETDGPSPLLDAPGLLPRLDRLALGADRLAGNSGRRVL